MRSAVQAYQTIAKQTVSPRDLEADLLLKAASRLQAVKDGWEGATNKLDDALLYNRKLWSIFLTSATSGDNPLPTDVRQNVANLGLFVMNQTMSVIADPKPERLVTLININRELAAGLRSGK
jgi:flagellar biosynthesis activator protein FlaF